MPIPISQSGDTSIIVSIIGTPGAGKSTWLAAAIQELSANIGPANGFDFQPVGELTRAHYRTNYYDPIFVRNEKIPPSDRKGIEEIHNPLVYSFTHQDTGESATFIFLDVAGEDLNDVEYMAHSLKYIHRSDVILHLIDLADIVNEEPRPIEIDVAGQAQSASTQITLNSMSASDILARIYELHTTHGVVAVGEKVSAPLGIIAAKLDRHVNTISKLDFSEVYSDKKIRENADLIKTFLFDSGVRGYLQSAKNRFDDSTCFGVSSLGHNPEIGTENIHPLGVTDPLVWALSRLNLLRGEE
ncbi:50S ribosome-binding GTPase [Puniceibacterium sp. IMCC21224]|nr:50S ribosome-binding GTPase [Puniceibacterium sp. IMCC21224]